jgi:uracil-DNA glycosylase
VEGEPGAHHGIGWDHFTRAVVQGIARLRPHCVVVLWGKQAQELAPDCGDLALVTSAHPSPLSAHRGFFGSRPFTAVNTLRGAASLPPLDWSLGEES